MNPKKNVAIPTLQFEKEQLCLSCSENINHPICPECISIWFKAWLEKFPKEKEKIKNIVDNFLKNHRHLNKESKLV